MTSNNTSSCLYLYLDESGECKISNTSHFSHFVIACIHTDDKRSIKYCLKKAYRPIYQAGWPKHEEIKASSLFRKEKYRKFIYGVMFNISEITNLGIRYIAVEKSKISNRNLREAPYGVRYNYCTYRVLKPIFNNNSNSLPDMHLIYDVRNKETKIRYNLTEYLQLKTLEHSIDSKREIVFTALPGKSHECYGLQVADFTSWAIYRKIRYNDTQYFSYIEHQVVSVDEWL